MSALPPGARFGDYEIAREIGRGGMGVVYQATEVSLHRTVALKILPSHLSDHEDSIHRFQQEARAVAQLNHPNVVTLFQIGEHEGLHFIAMEYLRGRELEEIIREEGYLSLPRALKLTRQIASALHSAHEVGIVHRDIKPQNVMVDANDDVKVMDFGVAKLGAAITTVVTANELMVGTPAYMAPEQFHSSNVDGRCDLYALGVLLYRCLAGRVPFEGSTPAEIMYRVLHEEPAPVRSFHDIKEGGVDELLQKALAKDPNHRFQTGQEFMSAIDQIRSTSGAQSLPTAETSTQVLTRPESDPDFESDTQPSEGSVFSWAGERFWNLPLALKATAAGLAVLLLLLVALSLRDDPQPPSPSDEWAAENQLSSAPPDSPSRIVPLIRSTSADSGAPSREDSLPAFTGAEVDMALALYTGANGQVDEVEARRLLEIAMAHGDPMASLWGAWFYREGRCRFERNLDRARDLAKRFIAEVEPMASQGNLQAQFLLGASLAEGLASAADPLRARSWIELAAEQGFSIAMNYLGWMYQEGIGVSPNPGLALLWYQRAAEAGDVIGMNNLGWIYLANDDVPGAEEIAVRWFRKAAEAGSPLNMTSLGWMLMNGRGVEKDRDAALVWYRRAAERGDREARSRLESAQTDSGVAEDPPPVQP